MASKIMILRHGEKPSGNGSFHIRGVTDSGERDDDELSVKGWQRAGALVRFFVPLHGHFTHPQLATPDVIFAAAVRGHIESLRSQHTVGPLAQFLDKRMNLKYTKGDEEALAAHILNTAGVALIAWEHKAIIEIVRHVLGDTLLAPAKWPDSRFDLVWVLDQTTTGKWKFTQVPQMLLPGDDPHVL